MELTYAARLACLVAVSMGLLQVSVEGLLWACSSVVVRLLQGLPLRHRERSLYVVQLLPFLFALLFTTSISATQYLLHETNFASEKVGTLCLGIALTVYCLWAIRIVLGGSVIFHTTRFSRACRRSADRLDDISRRPSTQLPVLTATGSGPRVALVGLIHPFILISRSLMDQGGLDAQALDIVFEHERSHAVQLDNWKLLSLCFLPRLNLKVSQGKTWMQLWQNNSEWAADEDAIRGNSARSLLLAETLVSLARSHPAQERRLAYNCLVNAETELAQRVERLIHRTSEQPEPRSFKRYLMLGCATVVAVIVLLSLTSALGEVPEHLLHLG